MGLRMTNPESQNTGIPVTYPVMAMVSTLRLLPTIPRMVLAMVRAAPVFSRIVPMMVPHRITIPMFPMMLPNPFFTMTMTFSDGIPHTSPTRIEMTVITMKGCILNFWMARIMSKTAMKITAK